MIANFHQTLLYFMFCLIKRNILGFMYKSRMVDLKTKISIYLFKQHSSNNIIFIIDVQYLSSMWHTDLMAWSTVAYWLYTGAAKVQNSM